jgi:hypothetical protein
MKPRALAAALGILLLLTAVPGGPARAGNGCRGEHERIDRHRGDPRARIRFIGVSRDGREHRGDRFRGRAVAAVRIIVDWKRLGMPGTQRLDLFTPRGDLYRSFTMTATGNAPVETRLPVAGTWITQHSMFGAWCAEVSLVGDDGPAARHGFVLAPR